MKGIVAEISGKSAVVLTQTGSFKKVKATSDMIIGKGIDLNRPAENSRMTRTVMKVTSLAAAGLLALGVGLGAYCYTLPYSYVHVDINPSIELTVNIFDRIISAEALNVDGEELLSNNDLRNTKVNAAVTQLLNAAVQQGYLNNNADQSANVSGQSSDIPDQSIDVPTTAKDVPVRTNPDEQKSIGDKPETTPDELAESEPKALEIANAVLVTVSSNNARKSDTMKKELADAVSVELDKDQVKSEILVAKASIEQRNDARQYGVTPGKLVLIEDAMEGKSETDLDKLKKTAIKDLLEMASDKKKDKEKLIEEKLKDAEKNKEKAEMDKAKEKTEAEKKITEAEKKITEAERKIKEAEKKKAETERKKAEAEKKKAEAERKKAEAERKKAEAERKKAEEKKDSSNNEHSIYKDAWNNWKADIKQEMDDSKNNKTDSRNDKTDSKNDNKKQANSENKSNKDGKPQPGDRNNTKDKTDTKDQWNQWNTNRKTRQELMDEHEKLKEELLEQMNDKLKNQNWKRDGQGNQHSNNMGSVNWRSGR